MKESITDRKSPVADSVDERFHLYSGAMIMIVGLLMIGTIVGFRYLKDVFWSQADSPYEISGIYTRPVHTPQLSYDEAGEGYRLSGEFGLDISGSSTSDNEEYQLTSGQTDNEEVSNTNPALLHL